MVAVVKELNDKLVTLARPSGLTWQATAWRIRPGTEYELRQLQALAKLQRVRLRGLS